MNSFYIKKHLFVKPLSPSHAWQTRYQSPLNANPRPCRTTSFLPVNRNHLSICFFRSLSHYSPPVRNGLLPSGSLRLAQAANTVIYICLVCLTVLIPAGHIIQSTILHNSRPRLVKTEWHLFLHTLAAHLQHPVIITRPRVTSRLAAHTHLLNRFVQILRQPNLPQQRSGNDRLVLYRQPEEDRQPVIGHRLVLHRATHQHVVVSIAPVGRDALHKAVYPLCEEIKPQILPHPHHLPTLLTPRVGILKQKIGGETGENQPSRRYLILFVPATLHRQIVVGRPPRQIAPYLAAVHLILPIHIAIPAPRTNLGASMPRIPINIQVIAIAHTFIFHIVIHLRPRSFPLLSHSHRRTSSKTSFPLLYCPP